MSSYFIVTMTIMLITACGQVDLKKSDVKITKYKAPAHSFTIADARKDLGKMVSAANKLGEKSVRYLADSLFLKASDAQATGDYVTANLIYEYLLKLTDDTFVKTKYSVSLIRVGDLERSKKYLKEVYEATGKKNLKVGLVLAGVYTGLSELKKARTVYQSILKKDKSNEDACIFLSKSYNLENNFKKAKRVLTSCERHNKKTGIFSYYIGKLYIESNNAKKARRYFRKSLKHDPNFSRSVLALGLIWEEKGKNNKAIKIYKDFIKRNPNSKLILSRLVQVLFTNDDLKAVIPYAEFLSDLEPDNLNLKVKLGILYTDARKYKKAIASFKELLNFAPTSDKILYYLGAIYQETKNYDDSIAYFNKIDDQSALFQDSSIQVANMLSIAAQKNDDYHNKFITFVDKKLDKMKKLKVEFSIIKASYFEGIKENKKAIATLEGIIDNANFKNSHKYFLATIYDKEKDYEKAYKLVKEVIKDNPKDAYSWNFIGYSYLERGVKLDEAFNYISKALSIKSDDPYILDSMGWYYHKVKDNKNALKMLSKAYKKMSTDTTISKHYAEILTVSKNYDKAKKVLIEALKFTKTSLDKAKITDGLKELESIRIPASSKSGK
jgi:tetratricopeptide (TPR) repeat protein